MKLIITIEMDKFDPDKKEEAIDLYYNHCQYLNNRFGCEASFGTTEMKED